MTGPASHHWVDAFLEMMAVERAAAKNTLTAYARDLADAQGFLAARRLDVATASAEDVGLFRRARRTGRLPGDGGPAAGGDPAVLQVRARGGLASRRPVTPGRGAEEGPAYPRC